MRPILLEKCKIERPSIDKALIEAYQAKKVKLDNVFPTGWFLERKDQFHEYLSEQGYKPRNCYNNNLIWTYVNGSAKWHTDPEFGLVVCWLLFESDVGCDGAQLITRHGPLDLRTGDTCVFDSNCGRAWICNGVSVMLMATVSKMKGR